MLPIITIFGLLLFSILILNMLSLPLIFQVNALSSVIHKPVILNDPHIKVEVIFSGIKFPTSMAFLGPNDILVLEKNIGTVKRIVNGTMLPEPLLDVNVATGRERGMLGIAVAKHDNRGPTYVFLYYTEAATKDGDDASEGQTPLGNRLYRYELINNKLANPKLLLDLPAIPGPQHNGGKVAIGPDQNVYVVIGDLGSPTKTQNIKNGTTDGRGGILRISQNGKIVGRGILGNTHPLNLYYAYGIRNSFGIDFDPITGKLWDTENGDFYGDEINLVKPGFNSGWKKIQGVWENNNEKIKLIASSLPKGLVDYGGKGKYSVPEFTWKTPVAATSLTFFNSTKLGKEYENDLFVGDFHNGYIYDFKLNKDRTKLVLRNQLTDKIADTKGELQNIIFAKEFGGITDMQIGPDGYLYVLSIHEGGDDCDVLRNKTNPCISYNSGVEGTIFRIVATNTETKTKYS